MDESHSIRSDMEPEKERISIEAVTTILKAVQDKKQG